jgi:hypothetical protein
MKGDFHLKTPIDSQPVTKFPALHISEFSFPFVPVPALSRFSPVYTLTACFFIIHLDALYYSITPRSPI